MRKSKPKDFWKRVKKIKKCWIWQGSINNKGYGIVTYRGKFYLAHRLSFYLTHEFMPKDCVLHKCDTPLCVNPHHFFVGTRADNNHDRVLKGREGNRKGSLNGRAKLNEKLVKDIRKRFETERITKTQLAEEYNVTDTLISWIISRKIWSHI